MPDLPSYGVPAGEIIEASTTRFVAQCPRERLHQPPILGTFVKALPPGARAASLVSSATTSSSAALRPFPARLQEDEDPFADPPSASIAGANGARADAMVPDDTLYALVCAASTGGADLGRRASAYGLEEAALAAEQPQIFDLLATEFVALPFGYVRNGRIRLGLPPQPPRLHAFVDGCDSAEVRALSDTPDFVRQMLAVSADVPPDELIAACLSHVYECRDRDFNFLVRAGKQLALLLRDDPERLAALLRKLQP